MRNEKLLAYAAAGLGIWYVLGAARRAAATAAAAMDPTSDQNLAYRGINAAIGGAGRVLMQDESSLPGSVIVSALTMNPLTGPTVALLRAAGASPGGSLGTWLYDAIHGAPTV